MNLTLFMLLFPRIILGLSVAAQKHLKKSGVAKFKQLTSSYRNHGRDYIMSSITGSSKEVEEFLGVLV